MPELLKVPRFKVGDKVQLKHGSRLIGIISEADGSYTPEAHVLYRVRVPMEPEPLWIVVRESEIDKI
jgi:hypothetical protein